MIQLESPSADIAAEPMGDPVYGRVFNTSALDAVQAEGAVSIRYREIEGHYYVDGARWRMREPHYQLGELNYGPLAPTTVVKPRVAPALFGVGLLELVSETDITDAAAKTRTGRREPREPARQLRPGARVPGRFGWQGESVSIRDQTTKAFALEMGLTSADRAYDDCTAAEVDCLRQPNGGTPEVSTEVLEAVVSFVGGLAAPETPTHVDHDSVGARLFAAIGCAVCHRSQLPVNLPAPNGARMQSIIDPYTDLRLHDLGVSMADETVSGAKVVSKWRTAPLWGLGYRMKVESHPTFLHDGRARSTEEAVLWHSGEAARARENFVNLFPRSREALLRWLETL